jgi:hypothetical protein
MTLRQSEALAGFKTAIDLENGKSQLATYAVILGHFAARLARDEVEAKAFLEGAAGKLDALVLNQA